MVKVLYCGEHDDWQCAILVIQQHDIDLESVDDYCLVVPLHEGEPITTRLTAQGVFAMMPS